MSVYSPVANVLLLATTEIPAQSRREPIGRFDVDLVHFDRLVLVDDFLCLRAGGCRPRSNLRPMRLSRRAKPFDSDDFIYELKIDGFLALAHIEEASWYRGMETAFVVSLNSPSGSPNTRKLKTLC
jgi:hypothetical protein